MELMSFTQSKAVLTRPKAVYYCQEEGAIVGRIQHAQIKELASRYSDNSKRLVLSLSIIAYSQNGEIPLSHDVPFNWHAGSRMVNLLENLELLPDIGCDLDLEAFSGMMIDMTIENVTKKARFFTNIIRLRKKA